MTPFYRFAKTVAQILFRIAFSMRYEGLENIPKEEPVILASNHKSNGDPVFMAGKLKRQIYFLAKESLFKLPVLGPIYKGLDAIPVNRGKGDSSSLDKCVERLKNGQLVGIFPEGTRSKTGKLGRLRSGVFVIAYESGIPVMPVALCYEKLGFRQKIVIKYGKPITHEEMGLKDATPTSLKQANGVLKEKIKALLEE